MGKERLLLGLLFVFLLGIGSLSAQTYQISGRVTGEGELLTGASVSVKGQPQRGAITNADGVYTLAVGKADVLVVSYIGFQTREVPVGGQSQVDISLLPDARALDEVVITIPYGTTKKSSFTGSVGYVDSKVIAKELVSNVSKALQGTVPGLQSFSSSGQPGSDASVYIRGVGSVNASSAPLYVVDGVPYEGSISSLSPQDIESVTVLKDAASAALYGSRAANGVIMIVTRQGRQDQAPQVQLSAKYGWSSRARADYQQLSTDQYFQLYWEALRNQRLDSGYELAAANAYASANLVGALGINPYGTAFAQPVGTDGQMAAGARALWNDSWDDALTQNAHFQQYDLSVSGGGKTSQYFFSAGYLDDQGAYIGSGFKRYTFRANIASQVKDWARVGINVNGTHSVQQYPKQDDSMTSNIIGFARNLQPFYPIYQRDPATGSLLTDDNGQPQWDFGRYRPNSFANMNLAATQEMNKNDIARNDMSLRSFVELSPLRDWTYKLTVNYDYGNRTNHFYVNPSLGEGEATGGSVSKENIQTTTFTVNNVISYSHTFGGLHQVRGMAGQEYYAFNTSNFGGTRTRVIADGYDEPDAASTLGSFYGNSDAYRMLSFFGSGEYNYAGRYYLSASVRSDGSSRFSPSRRWGTFWSVGGSWKISEEKFMQAARGWLYTLGLRASYGAQGNDQVGYYAYQALYTIANNLGESGVVASRLATPNLTWEKNLNLNIALDFGFWNNRLNGSIEFFDRRSQNLLFNLDLVPSSGYSSLDANIGALKNVGWELQVSGQPVKTKDWEWRLSANATAYTNTITSLPASEMWSGSKKWVKGGSLYDWYLIEWAGVNAENGNPQWYGIDDNGQKYITEDYSSLTNADKVKAGSSLPDVTGGFQSTLSWRSLSLSTFFSYSIGGKIYNSDKVSLLSQGPSGTAWSADMLGRWTPDNRYTDVPRLTTSPASSWTNSSTRFLVDRSYLKLKNISLGYSLPEKWVKRALLQEAIVSITAENLFTWTGSQGLDPEQTVDGTTYFRYPSMKSITVGLNIKL